MDLTALKPVLLHQPDDLETLLAGNPHLSLVDAFSRQLKELFLIDNNQFVGQDKKVVFAGQEFGKYAIDKTNEFVHIYFPWSGYVVKTVNEADYFRLITNRNQDLIDGNLQQKLYDFKVAVFGMSVGSNIAYVLTQAGISKEVTLADFDELDTTNLNRIWGGVHQVGLNKAVIAARKIYEANPFAQVNALTSGIDVPSLEKLLQEKRLNLIVEEIDSMQMKVEVRRLARQYKIPVVMIADNGDWINLTVERYDLGYDKIFNKEDAYWLSRLANLKSPKDFADIIINDMIGGRDKIDPKMLTSIERVFNKQLISWPQLGSAALLGGVTATFMIKEIVSGNEKRPYINEQVKPLI